jgi:hypothetical protein
MNTLKLKICAVVVLLVGLIAPSAFANSNPTIISPPSITIAKFKNFTFKATDFNYSDPDFDPFAGVTIT